MVQPFLRGVFDPDKTFRKGADLEGHRSRSSRINFALSLNLRPLKYFCHFSDTALASLMVMGVASSRMALTSPCKDRPCCLARDLRRLLTLDTPQREKIQQLFGLSGNVPP